MAGNWIKMKSDLAEEPEVIAMSRRLQIPELYVVGCLHAIWVWADAHTRDGHAHGVTAEWIDSKVRVTGFAQAMCDVGWLEVSDDSFTIPRFDRHNGDSAKTRAQATQRKQRELSAGLAATVDAIEVGVLYRGYGDRETALASTGLTL